jgi:hypothetical protein
MTIAMSVSFMMRAVMQCEIIMEIDLKECGPRELQAHLIIKKYKNLIFEYKINAGGWNATSGIFSHEHHRHANKTKNEPLA